MADEIDGARRTAHLAVHGNHLPLLFKDGTVFQNQFKIRHVSHAPGFHIHGSIHQAAENLFSRHGKIHPDGVDGRHGSERRAAGGNQFPHAGRRLGSQSPERRAYFGAVQIDPGVFQGGFRLLDARFRLFQSSLHLLKVLLRVRQVLDGNSPRPDQFVIAVQILLHPVQRSFRLKFDGTSRSQVGRLPVHGGLIGSRVNFKEQFSLVANGAVPVNLAYQRSGNLRPDVRLLHPAQMAEPGRFQLHRSLLHIHHGNLERRHFPPVCSIRSAVVFPAPCQPAQGRYQYIVCFHVVG